MKRSYSCTRTIARACLYPLLLTITVASAVGSTETIPAGSGTLSFNLSTVEYECQIGPPSKGHDAPPIDEEPYYISTFSDFSFTLSGVTTPLGGSLQQIVGPGANGTICPAKEAPSATWYPAPTFPFKSQNVISFATSTYEVGEATASATTATPGIIYPSFQVQSIIYDAPGNLSSNGYTNSETDGTSTSVGSSFTSGDTVTFSVSTGFLGLGSTISWSYGNSVTDGNGTDVTETISDASGVSNASAGGKNAINHTQDLFVIWINPAVVVYQTGTTSVGFAQGTQLQTTGDPNPGQPEAYQDQVEVFASAMMANGSGASAVPLEALVPHTAPDGESLPGLALICANHSYYPNSCTQANQCGCVPSDFAGILAQDPLLNYTSTESPLSADVSGATACASPTTSDSCRYVPVPTAPGSTVQETELLCGPQEVGGNDCVNTFTQTDSDTTTQTLSGSDSYTVGSSEQVSFKFLGSGISLTNANQWTWTNNESTGKIDGYSNSMTVTLSSNTLDCYQEIPIFEDTVYHTFVFVQPTGNSSCP